MPYIRALQGLRLIIHEQLQSGGWANNAHLICTCISAQRLLNACLTSVFPDCCVGGWLGSGISRYLAGYVALVAIDVTTMLVPYLYVKSLQLVWRSGTRIWNLRVPDLQMSCSDLTRTTGTTSLATRAAYPIDLAGMAATKMYVM